METKKPTKLLAYLTVATGLMLVVSGWNASRIFRIQPWIPQLDVLGEFLGVTAATFLGLIGGGMALIHGYNSITNKPSTPLKLAPFYMFWIVFAIALGLGNVLLVLQISLEFLFPFLFLLGASLPTLAVLAWAFKQLGWPVTWRQGALMMVAGGTLSVLVTLILGAVLPLIFYLLIEPLAIVTEEFLWIFISGGPGLLERMFYSPMLIFFFIYIAFQAPIPEELAKALGPALMGTRIQNERQAFAVGLAAGAGFAILENMLYQGVYAQWSGWSWGGITLLRGIGSVTHALWTAIISLALFRARKREKDWFSQLARAYLLSVGLHTLWNGGFDALVYLTGLDYYEGYGPSLSVYGLYIEIILVVYLGILSAGLWWLLRRYVSALGKGTEVDLAPTLVSQRALAGWALACVLVIIPIGAALGPAWSAIRVVLFGST